MTNLQKNRKNRVGCHLWTIHQAGIDAVPTFAEVGCGWVRCTRSMQMEIVCPAPRQYDFAAAGEAAVNRVLAQGMSVMGILDGRWWPEGERTRNLLPWASPIWEHLDLWGDFVTATVEHYRDRVKHWEVINEPPFFWWYPTSGDENALRRRAPIRYYADLLQVTAARVRSADPEAKIVIGSGFSDGLFLSKLYELGCKDAFDIASVHYLGCRHPDAFAAGVRRLRQVMAAHGDGDKPIWDTENGPGGAVIGKYVTTPEHYEACTNIYRHCFAHQFGIERYFWFNPILKGSDADHGSCLRAANGELTPAYQALKTLTERIGESELLDHRQFDGEGHLYVFAGAGRPVSVLWATAPATLRLTAPAEGVDYLGHPVSLGREQAIDGRPLLLEGNLLAAGATISVSGARECVIPLHRPLPEQVPTVVSPRMDGPVAWEEVPPLVTADAITVVEADVHFCQLPSSVPATVRLAHDDQALYLRVEAKDDRLDPRRPRGFFELAIRDSDPAITEWPHFFNAYGLYVVYVDGATARVLRYDTMAPDAYPGGPIPTATASFSVSGATLIYELRLPWNEIGPLRPGRHNPFLLQMNFNRADNLFDVPAECDPAEWSHNWADTFICKAPALIRWLEVV